MLPLQYILSKAFYIVSQSSTTTTAAAVAASVSTDTVSGATFVGEKSVESHSSIHH